jgi:hypothetical protein
MVAPVLATKALGLLDRRDDRRGRIDDGNRPQERSDQTPRRKEPRSGAELHKRSAEASRVDREAGPVNVPT